MRNYIFILSFIITFSVFGQEMTLTELGSIIEKVGDNVESNKSRWSFTINNKPLISIADSTHNRMRIISPIMKVEDLTEELKTASLMANFHTALDIKYAITDGVLWSIFVHPLRELTEKQIVDAISQVYYGNANFGNSFSSTSLVFPGRRIIKEVEEEVKKEQIIEKI